MSCGCAARMRKHILPNMGYTLEEGVWKNPDMKNEKLQSIPDREVSKYHTELTAKIALAYGKDKFYKWWLNITNKVITDIDAHWNELTTKYREYENEQRHVNTN